MEIILTDKTTGVQYKVAPLNNSLCWQIFKRPDARIVDGVAVGKNGKPVKSEWTPMERYPSTLHHAFLIVMEQMLMADEGSLEMEIDPGEPYAAWGPWMNGRAKEMVADVREA